MALYDIIVSEIYPADSSGGSSDKEQEEDTSRTSSKEGSFLGESEDDYFCENEISLSLIELIKFYKKAKKTSYPLI